MKVILLFFFLPLWISWKSYNETWKSTKMIYALQWVAQCVIHILNASKKWHSNVCVPESFS